MNINQLIFICQLSVITSSKSARCKLISKPYFDCYIQWSHYFKFSHFMV